MITHDSQREEIEDLQRLLINLGYLTELDESERGQWGERTHQAVLAAYRGIGWPRPTYGRWITLPALAALAAAGHAHDIDRTARSTGTGRGVGGPGSYTGGPGSHTGGPGSHTGGPGSHTGGPGSHTGGPGSHTG